MNKLWVIIQREYVTRVKKRSFLLTTIAVPVLIFGFYALMFFLALGGGGTTTKKIAVIDESGQFTQQIPNSKSIYFSYPNQPLDSLRNNLKSSEYNGILYIPELDLYKVNDNIKYYSDDKLGLGSKDYIQDKLEAKIKSLRMEQQGIDNSILDSLQVDMQLAEVGISNEKEDDIASELLSGIGYIMGFALYFVLIIFGTMVMKGVKEEKTNRIVEVIISSVKPFQLMLGKIVGIS